MYLEKATKLFDLAKHFWILMYTASGLKTLSNLKIFYIKYLVLFEYIIQQNHGIYIAINSTYKQSFSIQSYTYQLVLSSCKQGSNHRKLGSREVGTNYHLHWIIFMLEQYILNKKMMEVVDFVKVETEHLQPPNDY